MVPGGRFLCGWKKMAECLDNIVGRRSWRGVADRSISSISKSTNTLRGTVKQDHEAIKN